MTPTNYKLHLPDVGVEVIPFDVTARKGNQAAWPALQGVSIAQVEIPPKSWRGPHRHANAPELAIIVRGSARAGMQTPEGQTIELDLSEGDCVYFPTNWVHWLRNVGDKPVITYFNYGHELPVTEEICEVQE